MHVEHLDWLAKNPRYTQRFALHVGKLCRDMPNQRVAEMERLHHSTVNDLDKRYMQKQVERAGLPAPRAIGIDELSIRKGHKYRVIVTFMPVIGLNNPSARNTNHKARSRELVTQMPRTV